MGLLDLRSSRGQDAALSRLQSQDVALTAAGTSRIWAVVFLSLNLVFFGNVVAVPIELSTDLWQPAVPALDVPRGVLPRFENLRVSEKDGGLG